MRITLLGELGDENYELIWADGALRGTPRLVERFERAADEAGDDPLAFIAAVERGLPTRPQIVVWPEGRADGSADEDAAGGSVSLA